MEIIKIIYSFVPSFMKFKLVILSVLYFLGMLLDLLSIGLILPFMYFITDYEGLLKYDFIVVFLDLIGNPDQNTTVILSASLLFLVFIIKNIYLGFLAYYKEDFAYSIREFIAEDLFNKYINANISFHSKNNTATLQRNVIQLSQELSRSTQELLSGALELFSLLGIITFLAFIEPIGTLIVLVSLGTFSLILVFFVSPYIKIWGERRLFYSQAFIKIIQESLGMINEMRALRKIPYFYSIFSNTNRSYGAIARRENVLGQIPRLWMECSIVLSIVTFIIFLTLTRDSLGELLPLLAVFAFAGFRLLPAFSRIVGVRNQIQLKEPSIRRLSEEVKKEVHKQSLNKVILPISFNNSFKMKNISFKYSDELDPIFQDMNFEINKGEIIGIVGQSGSGKSTLLNLILGLLEPQKGQIEIDGKSFSKEIDLLNSLKFGIVPQEIFLIDASVKENITLGTISEDNQIDKLGRVIHDSSLNDFIDSLPQGVETITGERGASVSGGQRQRIGIARALYSEPEILIFDEATSALDLKTEELILDSIFKLKKEQTILVITHRTSSLKTCDRLFEVKNKQVIEI